MAIRVPPALNLAVLCSYVEFDADQRPFSLAEPLSAIGLIPDAQGRLPCPDLDLYVQLDDEEAHGTFWFLAEVRTSSGLVIPNGRTARVELTFSGNPDPLVPFEHVFHLRNLVFSEPGRYHIHVMCNHVSLHYHNTIWPPARLQVIPAEAPTRG